MAYLYSQGRQRGGVWRDLWRRLWLPTRRVRRQSFGGCSMGPSLIETKWGRIYDVWTARKDTATDQKGIVYFCIKYDDGTFDRYPRASMYLYRGEGFKFFSCS